MKIKSKSNSFMNFQGLIRPGTHHLLDFILSLLLAPTSSSDPLSAAWPHTPTPGFDHCICTCLPSDLHILASLLSFIPSNAISSEMPSPMVLCVLKWLEKLYSQYHTSLPMEFSRQEYWSGLPFPSLVDHVILELFAMAHLFWLVLHSMVHRFIELHKPLHHDKAVIHEGV